ncbi:hypothetical protein ACHAQJ_004796 [Trichoderma viride]
MRGHGDPVTEKAVGAEVRHSRAETGQRVGAMDDGPCPQRRILIKYVSETFLDSVALVRLMELYVACVSQKRRDYDGLQAPEAIRFVEMFHAFPRSMLSGHWDEPITLAADGLTGTGRITEPSDTDV